MTKALVLTGYGINCDGETAFAFQKAGAEAKIVHVNDLIKQPKMLEEYQIFAFPGGFAYGDDTGSGNALANKIKNNLWEDLMQFIEGEKLVIGICNGFQVLANLGLLPGISGKYGERTVALAHNNTARFQCRWVSLRIYSKKCVFTKGIEEIRMPVAHGEGKFTALGDVLKKLQENDQIVLKYTKGKGLANGEFPFNPNGSLQDIAGICDGKGRVFGLMPHPERNIFFTQPDDWTLQKELLKRSRGCMPTEGAGMQVFRNAVDFFR